MLTPRARQIESDARDAFDLRRPIDHRIHRLLDAVYGSLFLGPAVIDPAGQLAHDDQVETATISGRSEEASSSPGKTRTGRKFAKSS